MKIVFDTNIDEKAKHYRYRIRTPAAYVWF